MNYKLHVLPVLAISIFFGGCSSNDDDPIPTIPTVFAVNEGNFLSANGSISSYDGNTSTVTQDVYEANATIQNLRVFGGNYYLVGNAPDKVEILDADLALQSAVAEGLDNPIDLAIDGSRAFVTNWGDINTAFSDEPDSYLAIINLTTNTVTDSILLDHRPQDIELANNQLFITHEAAAVMTVVDIASSAVSSIEVPAGSSEMVRDADGDIWVLCTSGTLFELDPRTAEIKTTIEGLTVGGFNEKMAIDALNDRLYFLGGSNDSFTGRTTVFVVDVTSENPAAEVFIADGFALYGVAVDEASGDVYIGDSNGFQSTGTGFRYDSDGTLVEDFATGIGPRSFLFAEN